MIRIVLDSGSRKFFAINSRLVHALACCLLLALSSGCIGGASGGAKTGLFDRFDKRDEASGSAALRPIVVCPTCSVPVGVAVNGTSAAVQPVPPVPGATTAEDAQSHAAANSQPVAVGTVAQPSENLQSPPTVPQVPPEGSAILHDGAVDLANVPSGTNAAITQPANVAEQSVNQQLQQPVVTNHSPSSVADSGAGQRNSSMTWEQSQAAHLRTQQAMQMPSNQMAHVTQTAPANNMVPIQEPTQQIACVPGTAVAKNFAGQWYESTQTGSLNNGAECPPTPVEADLKNCRDEMARMKSEFEQMRASQEKANEAAQALAAKQQQIERQNRDLKRQYEQERLEELERLKVLSEIIDEIPKDDATPDQPQPQASKRTKVPVRVASSSRVQAADRTTPRRVTLPSVDE